jgi:hypothetical protein
MIKFNFYRTAIVHFFKKTYSQKTTKKTRKPCCYAVSALIAKIGIMSAKKLM